MTRAALLVEQKDKNGQPIFIVYHLLLNQMSIEHEYDRTFNIFEATTRILPTPARLTVDAYLTDPNPRPWNGTMPDPEQEEIEPVHLAIESNEPDEIVIDEDGFEEYQGED